MLETKRLNRLELNELINNAPKTEARNLLRITDNLGINPYDFFDKYAVEHSGIINNRPIYMACIIPNAKKEYELWTIVNSDVKEQFSLFKISKRVLMQWLGKYKEIYATMEKNNLKNMRWTERLGFKKTRENNNLITYLLGINL